MASVPVTAQALTDWLLRYRDLVMAQRDYLTELDSAIGDADHGINMTRGMDAVVASLSEAPPGTVDRLLKGAGMTLVSTVGGAAGPLYGTFFLRCAAAVGSVPAVSASELGAALRAGAEGVVALGKAQRGDKTMVDALSPAVIAFEVAVEDGGSAARAAAAASSAAESGRDATMPMIARKGRASYLGERSAGHLDPGAASSALLFQALAEAFATADAHG